MWLLKQHKTFDEIVPGYLASRKILLKPRSYIGDVGMLKAFSLWLASNNLSEHPLTKISKLHISNFFASLANIKNLDKPTCQKYLTVLRFVWQFAQKAGEFKGDLPFDLVTIPKKRGDFSPELIPKEVFVPLCEAIKGKDPQLYLAAMMEYYSFIRPNELRNLKTDDIFLDEGFIKVSDLIAKTKVTRYPTITKDLKEVFLWFGIDKAPKGMYIFGKKGYGEVKHIGINTLSHRFRKFRKQFGLNKRVRLYSFKHTGITDMLNAGVPLIAVMQQAGHARLSSTQHYAKKYSEKVNKDLLNYSRMAS